MPNLRFIRKLAMGMGERQKVSQVLINNLKGFDLITSGKPSMSSHSPCSVSPLKPQARNSPCSLRSHQGHPGRVLRLSPHTPFHPKPAPTNSLRKVTGEEAPESRSGAKAAARQSCHRSDRSPLQQTHGRHGYSGHLKNRGEKREPRKPIYQQERNRKATMLSEGKAFPGLSIRSA